MRNSFTRRRVTVKWSDLVSGQTSKQYNSIGRHLLFTYSVGRPVRWQHLFEAIWISKTRESSASLSNLSIRHVYTRRLSSVPLQAHKSSPRSNVRRLSIAWCWPEHPIDPQTATSYDLAALAHCLPTKCQELTSNSCTAAQSPIGVDLGVALKSVGHRRSIICLAMVTAGRFELHLPASLNKISAQAWRLKRPP